MLDRKLESSSDCGSSRDEESRHREAQGKEHVMVKWCYEIMYEEMGSCPTDLSLLKNLTRPMHECGS